MPDATYNDTAYPPVGANLRYQRGDGAIVTLSITYPDQTPGELIQLAPALAQVPSEFPTLALTDVPFEAPFGKKPTVQPASNTLFDHPTIGGKFTIFVLLYGPNTYHQLHRRCLDAIVSSVPIGRMDLRIGSNALCRESVQYVERLVDRGIVTKHYLHPRNDKKYPVMREMFHDPALPVTTNWLIWFDDDSIANRNQDWLSLLAQQIVENHPRNCHMYGAKYIWTLQAGQDVWYRGRPWYKGRQFRDKSGKPVPNGNKVLFCTGGFWAISAEAMQACGIPDAELGHNGGDVLIGEQLYQGGFEIKSFNGHKTLVHTSSVPRRGLSEKHPGTG